MSQENPWLLYSLIAVVVIILMGCIGVGIGWLVYSQRTAGSPATSVAIPTSPAPTSSGGNLGSGELTRTPEGAFELAPTATSPIPSPVAATPESANADVAIQRTSSPPAIDGALNDWPDIPVTDSDALVYSVSGWDGSADLVALWRLQWDPTYLYIAVEVVDDTHVQIESGNQIFRGDSLDMQFDTDLAGDSTAAVVSPDDYQMIFSPGDFGSLPPSAFRFRGTTNGAMLDSVGHSIQVAAQATDGGYVLEARISWIDLGMAPTPDLVFGLNLNANDNDTPGTAVQEVMLSNNPNRTFRDPTTWGTAQLLDGP